MLTIPEEMKYRIKRFGPQQSPRNKHTRLCHHGNRPAVQIFHLNSIRHMVCRQKYRRQNHARNQYQDHAHITYFHKLISHRNSRTQTGYLSIAGILQNRKQLFSTERNSFPF